jgi:hypothetical protein
MSQWTSHRNHPALMTRQTWLMDRMFAELRPLLVLHAFRFIGLSFLVPGLRKSNQWASSS